MIKVLSLSFLASLIAGIALVILFSGKTNVVYADTEKDFSVSLVIAFHVFMICFFTLGIFFSPGSANGLYLSSTIYIVLLFFIFVGTVGILDDEKIGTLYPIILYDVAYAFFQANLYAVICFGCLLPSSILALASSMAQEEVVGILFIFKK